MKPGAFYLTNGRLWRGGGATSASHAALALGTHPKKARRSRLGRVSAGRGCGWPLHQAVVDVLEGLGRLHAAAAVAHKQSANVVAHLRVCLKKTAKYTYPRVLDQGKRRPVPHRNSADCQGGPEPSSTFFSPNALPPPVSHHQSSPKRPPTTSLPPGALLPPVSYHQSPTTSLPQTPSRHLPSGGRGGRLARRRR